MRKPPEKSIIINICVTPGNVVSRKILEISKSLRSDKTVFVLGGDMFAHMTVYMARFNIDKVENVIAAAEKALTHAKSFQCLHTGYFMTEGRYLEASYRKSNEFIQLHESLIEVVSNLRINPNDPFEESYFAPYTAEQEQNARETGYDLAHNLFRPHVTLTRYIEKGVPTAFPGLPEADLSFPLNKVCVYKADENGSVHELLKEFVIS